MGATTKTIDFIVDNNLCINCGLCAAGCPKSTIKMTWLSSGVWLPVRGESNCTDCGTCYRICPQSPECITEYADAAAKSGCMFGLSDAHDYFISYDIDAEKRKLSASGGTISVLLKYLLEYNLVDGIVASIPTSANIGNPHYQVQIFRKKEDLDKGRSSHYHPLNYEDAISEIAKGSGSYALLGVPCIIRGIKRLPGKIQNKIRYKISLCCSHNVTGAFTDCLSQKEGINKDEPFWVNLRDKKDIPDANNFNNYFRSANGEIRRNRFKTQFTDMWRNYFFAQECCLYCPDFYGVDADISVKDAWGRLSADPLGTSLLVVRNKELTGHLTHLRDAGNLYLERCDADEVFNSQPQTPVFKHISVRDRLVWKRSIRGYLLESNYPLESNISRWSEESFEYLRLRSLMSLSNIFYFKLGHVPVKSLIRLSHLFTRTAALLKWLPKLRNFLFLHSPKRVVNKGNLRVLIAGGYGYGNIGDEAQLAANLRHWKKAFPMSQLTVLTPNPEYTNKTHGNIRTELATRISLFGAGDRQYYGSDSRFKKLYFLVAPLYLLNARLMRAGLPTVGLTARQAAALAMIRDSEVIFLSGGGYLTGMTLTRLWDNMLLLRLANIFGITVLLSGQTIGVFKDPVSRFLAKWGLKTAKYIYLRDPINSSKELASIGIKGEKIKSTFDDALFYKPEFEGKISEFLDENGIDENKYIAVNVHYWGQHIDVSRIIMKQVADSLDRIKSKLGLQIVFVPMVGSDEETIKEVMSLMKETAILPQHHNYDLDLIVALVQNAFLCLTMKHHPIIFAMGAGVPTVSMAFDDYYWHKNEGALRIFGQERYMVSCEPDKLGKSIDENVMGIYNTRDELSAQIKLCLDKLRPLAGEVIYKYKEMINLAVVNENEWAFNSTKEAKKGISQ